ncbi:M28 family metallopeptidase [Fodinibius halophilus]|uniref:Carboxypeptidase Q n=1 Tax=Fodinibius halophilus TaxID=1736908 RepID=A0A6M1T7Y4_9BACT|nr:M28 family metallopeptidase [Fodinibius halophilus]NGP88081.1 M20/M25/M40 family metallo-hydrolase [Fodinibius halophilus]
MRSYTKTVLLLSIFILGLMISANAQEESEIVDVSSYQDEAQKIIDAALADEEAFQKLTYFVDKYGHRLSGSETLENSIDWILKEMQEQPFDNVTSQKVMVPHWVRDEESATLVSPYKRDLPMLGLGGSVGTLENGVEAEVLVVENFKDLKKKAEQAKGKIIVYNVPFTSYGETVQYRYRGAVEAAKVGAVASLIRSVTPFSMQTPHTGNSAYEEGIKKIPQAAITVEHAKLLHRLQKMGKSIKIHLSMDAKILPDAPSRNIIAEIKGSEKPEEIVVLGGHIDAWDVGQGAMDDAGGCFAAWEAVMLMKELGLKPKRTIRVVMWTNEENGLRGATAYRDMVKENGNLKNHVLAIESDGGVFEPRGFGFGGTDKGYEIVSKIGTLLVPIGADTVNRGGGGADIGPIMREGVPGMGLLVDHSRYFWYHHTAADTIDKLDEEEYQKCIATMAIMAYVAADLPQRIPFGN